MRATVSPKRGLGRFLPGVAAALALLLLPGRSALAGSGGVPQLQGLLETADIAVAARVSGATSYDDGRVVVDHLHVLRRLKVKPMFAERISGDTIDVVEVRDLQAPPLLRAGALVVAFLRPAAMNSYLRRTLPKGRYLQPVHGAGGLLVSSTAAQADEVADIVARLVEGREHPPRDAAERAASFRELTFEMLPSEQPALIVDAASRLKRIADLASTLAPAEQQRLEKALSAKEVPAYARRVLIEAIADCGLTQLAPALARLREPQLMAASWKALDRLGASPGAKTVRDAAASEDPAVRAAAVPEILRAEGNDAIADVKRIAEKDSDAAVREAAIQSLGENGTPAAVEALQEIYVGPDWKTTQAAARAILKIGGQTAAETFSTLANRGSREQQRYAVMVLLSLVGKDDPAVRRIAKTHPDQNIRDMIEHGVRLAD